MRLALAAPHALAVRAAERVADEGGNVVEAAVAAAAALTVVYPHMTSLGGDLFTLLRSPDGTVRSANASGAYGSGTTPQLERMPVTGPLTVTVPGAVAGWQWLLEHGGGSLPLHRVLQPAIDLASDGAPLGSRLAGAMARASTDPDLDAGLRELLVDEHGTVLRAGDTLRQPRLAATLRHLADHGLADFYQGSLGDRLTAAFGRLGIPVGRQDLADHSVLDDEPLEATAAGCRVMSSPPNSQGYLLLTTLLAIDDYARRGLPVDGGTLVDLFALAGQRRGRELADPRTMTVGVDDLLTAEAISSDVDKLLADPRRSPAAAMKPDGDTIAITAVGADGTAVSLIQSLFSSFGSRVRDPDTGIVFHNRGAFFSVDPGSPNVLAPRKRPAHTLMPVLVEHPDGTVTALGTMGGLAQPQIHTQVLRALLEGAGPQEAVAAPRFLVDHLDDSGTESVLAESDLAPDQLAEVRRSGLAVHETHPQDEALGHAMVCTLGPDGQLSAGADPRSDGDVFVRT